MAMSKEAVFKLLPPDEQLKVDFTVVTRGEIYAETGEEFDPNDTLISNNHRRVWCWKRFIVTDEVGQRTYFEPGDIAPSEKYHQLGWGFALAIDASLSEGTLIYSRIKPDTGLEPITIGESWTMRESSLCLDTVSSIAVTSPRYLDIARGPSIPKVDSTIFQTVEEELVRANFGASLHKVGRTILNISVES